MAADGPYFFPLFIVIQRIVHEIKKVMPADEVIFDDDYFPILFHDLGNTADHGSGKALMFRCLSNMYRTDILFRVLTSATFSESPFFAAFEASKQKKICFRRKKVIVQCR